VSRSQRIDDMEEDDAGRVLPSWPNASEGHPTIREDRTMLGVVDLPPAMTGNQLAWGKSAGPAGARH